MLALRFALSLTLAVAVSSQSTCEAGSDECGGAVVNDVTFLQTAAALDSVESPKPVAALHKSVQISKRGKSISSRQKDQRQRRMAKKGMSSKDTTTTTTTGDDSAAEASGISANESGDLSAFISADITNIFAVLFFCVVFVYERQRYPAMFNYNSMIGLVKDTPPNDWTSWIWAAAEKQREEHVKTCGLDHAMLLEMCVLSMRICAWIFLPMTFLVGPLILFYGNGDASQTGDNLSLIGINNIEEGSWLMYLYGPATLGVVFMLKYEVNRSMRTFCKFRSQWLKDLQDPQASTIMVEGIPEEYQSADKLRDFFGKMFDPSDIKDVDMVLYIPELESACAQLETSKAALAEKTQQWENDGKKEDARPQMSSLGSSVLGSSGETDAIKYYSAEVERLESEVTTLRQTAMKQAKDEVGGINSSTAFVRFASRKQARVSVSVAFTGDKNEFIITAADPPAEMIYADLKVSEESKGGQRALGLAMVFGLYVAFTPFCVWVTNISDSITLPEAIQSTWESYAPTLGLLIFLSFIPSVFIVIFSMLFHYKTELAVQKQLQVWYFWFLFFFVILVTVIGSGFLDFIEELAADPLYFPQMLAEAMPSATHYYLNYLGAQWFTHGMNLIRYIQVFKYVGFCNLWDEEDARKMSEPEDQDYYGMGSRSARFTINLMIVIVMGTMSPLMGMQGWVNFVVCRIIYGYLFVYAEGKKADSGGVFFVKQMQHVWLGAFFYTFLMIGLCLSRAPDNIPVYMTILAFIYVCYAYRKFETDYEWENLPWADMCLTADGKERDREDTGAKFIQPELLQAK